MSDPNPPEPSMSLQHLARQKGKIRLDQYLVESGLCQSKAQAQGMIIARQVRLEGKVQDKPGSQYALQRLEDAKEKGGIEIEQPLAYVSRGGLKLEKALDTFNVDPQGRICLDVGASTGGFTDCLLQRGASKVYAIDVGHGQLDWKLRQDERVISLEKTNIKTLSPERCPELYQDPISLCVMDISFISIKKALPVILEIFEASLSRLQQPPTLISLIKPQFEYKDYCSAPGFDGVVREPDHHLTVLSGLLKDIDDRYPDLKLLDLSFSPVTGPKGNIEFLLLATYKPDALSAGQPGPTESLKDLAGLVQKAHQHLIHAAPRA